MAILEHPSSADLLLWQSGELSPERTEDVRCHLAECEECQQKVAELESLYEGVAVVDDHAAQYRIREVLEQRHRPFWRRLQFNSRWTATTATVVIGALLLVTFTEYTPSARAEMLLNHAVKEESSETSRPHLLQVQSSGMNCNIVVTQAAVMVSASGSNENFCGRLTTNLHAAGWSWNDLLSAHSFKQWRASLKEKKDAVKKLSDADEVTTATSHGPVHRATLRLRSTDYRPTEARFVFVSTTGEEEPEIEVLSNETIPLEVARTTPAPLPTEPHPAPAPVLPPVNPLDLTEAEVRLTLHRLGADKNVLLAVNREPDDIRVSGVVPDKAQAASLTSSLVSLPKVKTQVVVEGEGSPASNWQSFQGNAPPLAYEKVNELYPDDPQERQRFVNNVDMITRRLVAEAKNQDGLLTLENRLRPHAEAEQLTPTLADTQSNVNADLSSLATVLEPIIGPVKPQPAPLTYAQATQLYTLVHELIFMNNSDNPFGLDESAAQVRRLIAGK